VPEGAALPSGLRSRSRPSPSSLCFSLLPKPQITYPPFTSSSHSIWPYMQERNSSNKTWNVFTMHLIASAHAPPDQAPEVQDLESGDALEVRGEARAASGAELVLAAAREMVGSGLQWRVCTPHPTPPHP
jgi:hypothetical protein